VEKKLVQVRFPDGELGRWACLGAVSDRAVRVWLREPAGGPQRATLSIDGEVVGETELRPDPAHDWIDAADLTLEQPRPEAELLVRVAGLERRGRFAPTPGSPTSFSFGFGSCHEPFVPGPEGALGIHPGAGLYPPMAQLLQVRGARFLALVGDQVYTDGVRPIELRDQMRARRPPPSDQELLARCQWLYRGYFNQAGFKALLESLPTVMIWDDHDIFEGWGSLLDWDELDARVVQAAETTYRAYQHLHNHGARVDDQAPYHYCFWYGNVGFFTLDLRGVRSYQDGRLLGERQWRDLEAFLAEATARDVPTLFIIASIPVVHHSPIMARLLEWIPVRFGTDIRDRWSALPIAHERAKFLERILDWQTGAPARQVVVLSGDVHAGAAFRYRRPGGGSLHQWTSSPLSTHPKPAEHLANLLGSTLVGLGEGRAEIERLALEWRNNFGLVQVTALPSGGHRLELGLHAYRAERADLELAVQLVSTPG
jgi:alkaline phosphatase D